MLQEIKNIFAPVHSSRFERTLLLAEIEQRNVPERNVVEIEIPAEIELRLNQLA